MLRRRTHWVLAIGSVLIATLLFNLLELAHPGAGFVANDVGYYGYHLNQLDKGSPTAMQEYPVPALWFIQLLYRLGGGWQTWRPLFAIVMLAIVIAVAVALFRAGRPQASFFWVSFTGAMGAIIWFRFDLVPAALVAFGAMYALTQPRLAGALVAAGAAVKLWPAVLLFPLAAPSPHRRGPGQQRLVGFVVGGLVLALISLLVAGWDRNVSPLTWQSERGLQIESVAASPFLFLRSFTSLRLWPSGMSEFNSIELTGPGTGLAVMLTKVFFAATVVLAVTLAVRLSRFTTAPADVPPAAMQLALLSIVLAIIVANKTLSPQYIVWLAGPAAALALVEDPPAWLIRPRRVILVWLVGIAALTRYTYPWATLGIIATPNGNGFETSFLLLRNLCLVLLLGYTSWLTWRAARVPTLPQ